MLNNHYERQLKRKEEQLKRKKERERKNNYKILLKMKKNI